MVSEGLVRKRPYVIGTGNTPSPLGQADGMRVQVLKPACPSASNHTFISAGIHSLHSGFGQE
jgi:hypothetical protein